MDYNLVKKLESFINAELTDAELYRRLSKIATSDFDKGLLLEFASDEQSHAEDFMKIYGYLTGTNFDATLNKINLSGNYRDILKDRVIDESGDFRKYGELYIATDKNSMLKSALYKARTDEAVHAMRLLDMLSN